MSVEEPDFSSHHHIDSAVSLNLDKSSTIDCSAGMGTTQAVDSIEEEVGKSMNVEKKMKKKIFLLSQEKVDYYLSIRLKPVPRRLIERDPLAGAEKVKLRERVLAQQEEMRREYEARGYVTYIAEVPDDGTTYQGEVGVVDDEEKDAAAVVKQVDVIIHEKKEEDASAIVKQDEIIVDEKKEEAEAEVTDGVAPLTFPHGRGRRRFRPGVVKQTGGGVKKIVM